jgi:ferredoxin
LSWVDVEGVGAIEVEDGKRLVLAIEEDAGVDILHRCGGFARCTTCRIEYLEGEPERMTRAELEVLKRKELLGSGARLSCQAAVDRDVRVWPMMTVASTGAVSAGRTPEPGITPDPEWMAKPTTATP